MRKSERRIQILEFIRDFIGKRGYAPTISEIQKGLRISSNSVVEYHLRGLEQEGHIRRDATVSRSIQVSGIGERAWVVPVLGVIAAGHPVPVPTEGVWYSRPLGFVNVPKDLLPDPSGAYALKVKGSSMIDALVDDGDIVIIKATSTANDGEMVAAWLIDREEATLKRLYRESGRIRLQPANRTMAPIYVEPDKIEVQGRVIAVLRRYLVAE